MDIFTGSAFDNTGLTSTGISPFINAPGAVNYSPSSSYAFNLTHSIIKPLSDDLGSQIGMTSRGDLISQQDLYAPSRNLVNRVDMTLDRDPFGTDTEEYNRRLGIQDEKRIRGLSVFGRYMTYEQLEQTESGRELLEIAGRNREGRKRGFLDAITDFKWSDLPFMSLIETVAGSAADAVTVSDTLKKLQNGEPVTDDELIKTRLYMANQEFQQTGGIGSMIGDIVRAAPGFMAEFFIGGWLLRGVASAISLIGRGSKVIQSALKLSRITKMGAEYAAETTAKTAVTAAAKAAATTAESADTVTSAAWKALSTVNSAERTAALAKIQADITASVAADMGMAPTSDIVFQTAARRAQTALDRVIARESTNNVISRWSVNAWQGLREHTSRALLDFGGFGSELPTVNPDGLGSSWKYLNNALGYFTVEAPIKGAVMMAPQQLAVRPLLSSAFGKDGRVVSASELSLQADAYKSGNKQLMADAHAYAFGLNFLEYASEASGPGFNSLFKAIGGGSKLTSKAARKAIEDGLVSKEAMLDAGSWFRRMIHKVVGTDSQVRQGVLDNQRVAVKAMLRKAADEAEKGVQTAATAETRAAAAATAKELRSVSDESIIKFIGSMNADELGSAAAKKLVEDNKGAKKFLRTAMKSAISQQETGITFKRFAQFVVADKMVRMGLTPDKTLDWLSQAGYDGIVQEMMEERYSDFVKGLTGWDSRTAADKGFFKNMRQAVENLWPGWDQLVAEAVGFAVPMVTRITVNRVQQAAGGSDLSSVKYFGELLRGMHAGSYVNMRTKDWFAQADESIADFDERLRYARPETADATALADEKESLIREQEAADDIRREEINGRLRKIEQLESYSKLSDEDVEQLKGAREAVRLQRERVMDSIGGAAQVTSEKFRWLEALNTQVNDAKTAQRHNTPTADASLKAAAAYSYLCEHAGEVGRLLADSRDFNTIDVPMSWRRRIAVGATRFIGALMTGDLSLFRNDPVQWTALDNGFDQTLVNSLAALSANYDASAELEIITERGYDLKKDTDAITSVSDRIKKTNSEIEDYRRKYSIGKDVVDQDAFLGKVTDAGEKEQLTKLFNSLNTDVEELSNLKDRQQQKRDEFAKKKGVTTSEIRARSNEDYNKAASLFMASWLSKKDMKFFQQSEMQDIAERHVMKEYGFIPGNPKTVEGSEVTTAAEFLELPAVKAKVDDATQRIARITNAMVHNRYFTTANQSDPYKTPYGNAFINISMDNPLFNDALLSAALEQVGMSHLAWMTELSDDVPLTDLFKNSAVSYDDIQVAASLYDKVMSKGEKSITDEEEQMLNSLAVRLGFPRTGVSPKALSTRKERVVSLARKLIQVHNTTAWRSWTREQDITERGYETDPAVTSTRETVRAYKDAGGLWSWTEVDADGKKTEFKGKTEAEMNEHFSNSGYSVDPVTLIFGRTSHVGARSAAALIDKFGYYKFYMSRMLAGNVKLDGVEGSESDIQDTYLADPRFRIVKVDPVYEERDGKRVQVNPGQVKRKYTGKEADEVRRQEVIRANRFARLGVTKNGPLQDATVFLNYRNEDKSATEEELKRRIAYDRVLYRRVYGSEDGKIQGYMTMLHEVIRKLQPNVRIPDKAAMHESGGVLENPYHSILPAYVCEIGSLASSMTGGSIYVPVKGRFSGVASYDSAITRALVNNAFTAHRRELVGDYGGLQNNGYSDIIHKFERRARETLIRLANDAYNRNDIESGKQFDALYDQLFSRASEVSDGHGGYVYNLDINTVKKLIQDVILRQRDRDLESGNLVRSASMDPYMQFITAVRSTPEYLTMHIVVDWMFGGSTFTAGQPDKDAIPTRGLLWVMGVLDGSLSKGVGSILGGIVPKGVDRKAFLTTLKNAFDAEVLNRTGGKKLTPETDIPIGDGVTDERFVGFLPSLFNAMNIKTPEQVKEFFDAVATRAGVFAGLTDLVNWKEHIALAAKKRAKDAADFKELRTSYENLGKKIKELKEELQKLQEADDKGNSEKIKDLAGQISELEAEFDSVVQKIKETEAKAKGEEGEEGEGEEETPEPTDEREKKNSETPVEKPGDPEPDPFGIDPDVAAADGADPVMPAASPEGLPEAELAKLEELEKELKEGRNAETPALQNVVPLDVLGDLRMDPDRDEVKSASRTVIGLTAIIDPGALTELSSPGASDARIRNLIYTYFTNPSDADVTNIINRVKEFMTGITKESGGVSDLGLASALANADPETTLVMSIQEFLNKNNGTDTKDSNGFGDSSVTAFKAMNPFTRVLSLTAGWTGTSLQAFLSESRVMITESVTRFEKALSAMEQEDPARAELQEIIDQLVTARRLLTQRTNELGKASLTERMADHNTYVDKFCEDTPESRIRWERLLKALTTEVDILGRRDSVGIKTPVSRSLAVFFSYLSTLPTGGRAAILKFTSGMTPTGTALVFREKAHMVTNEDKVDSEGNPERVLVPETYGITSVDTGEIRCSADYLAEPFLQVFNLGGFEAVERLYNSLYIEWASHNDKTPGGTEAKEGFPDILSEGALKGDAATVGQIFSKWDDASARKEYRRTWYRAFVDFQKAARLAASMFDNVFGTTENPFSVMLRSETLLRLMREKVMYGDAQDYVELAAIYRALSWDPGLDSSGKPREWKANNLPFAIDEVRVTLRQFVEGEDHTKENLVRRFRDMFTNGDPRTGSVQFGTSTAMRTGEWTTLLSWYTQSLPRTTVLSSVVRGRTEAGARPSVAVSTRGNIPILDRFFTMEADESVNHDSYEYKLTFRGMAEHVLRTELTAEYDLGVGLKNKSDEGREAYIKKYIESRGGLDAIIEECQRTNCWPGRTRRPIIVRNTAVAYRHDEVTIACAEDFAKGDNRFFYIPLYAGDHSSNNLIQIPMLPEFAHVKPMAMDRMHMGALFRRHRSEGDAIDIKNAGTTRYMAVVRHVNDAIGVSLMGKDAKRSAITSADAEQIPMAGVTFDLDEHNNIINSKRGSCRIAVFSHLGTDAITGGKFINEELKGEMLTFGYGTESFRKMSKNPDLRTGKFHFISHGRHLGFLKSASHTVPFDSSEGDFKPGSYSRAIADHLRMMMGATDRERADEWNRSTILAADFDSYKVGVGSSNVLFVTDATGKKIGSLFDVIQEVLKANQGSLKSGETMSSEDIQKLIEEKYGSSLQFTSSIPGQARTDVKLSIEEVLPGLEVRVVDNVPGKGGVMVSMSYTDNTVMGIRAANISHISTPEIGHTYTNYMTDMITKAIDQGLDDETDLISNRVIDVVNAYALLSGAVATHEDSRRRLFESDPRVTRESAASGKLPGDTTGPDSIPEANKKSDVLAAKLRSSMLAPSYKADMTLTACGATLSIDETTGEWVYVDHTESEMLRAFHQGSMVLGDKEAEFYGAKLKTQYGLRRLGSAEVNVRDVAFRYNLFLDEQGFSKSFDDAIWMPAEAADIESPDAKLLLKMEYVFTKLREAERSPDHSVVVNGERIQAVAIRDRLAGSFRNHHNQLLSELPSNRQYHRYMNFEDLFMEDGNGGRTFDRTAVMIDAFGENDRVSLITYEKKDGKMIPVDNGRHIVLCGSIIGVPRTPSYNTGPWNQTVRATFPVTESFETDSTGKTYWSVGKDALVAVDPQTLYIAGCDNDGDEAMVFFYNSRQGVSDFADAIVPELLKFAEGLEDNPARITSGTPEALAKLEEERNALLSRLSETTYDGQEVPEGTKDKSLIRKVVVRRGKEDNFGFSISRETEKAFSNSVTQVLFDMSRRAAVPVAPGEAGSRGRIRFAGRVAKDTKEFNGVESFPTKPSVLDDKKLWNAMITENCPPDILSEIGTIGDLWSQLATERSADEASSARAGQVRGNAHMHVAFFSGLFEKFEQEGKDHKQNPYGIFPAKTTRREWMSFMRYLDGLANMTFDDVKARICSRFGLNQAMVDTIITDILLQRTDRGLVARGVHARLPQSDADFQPILTTYIRSARDQQPVLDREGNPVLDKNGKRKWKPVINLDSPGATRLSLKNDVSRRFMVVASGTHVEDEDVRKHMLDKMFGNEYSVGARKNEVMKLLGIEGYVTEDGFYGIRMAPGVENSGTVREKIAKKFISKWILYSKQKFPGCSTNIDSSNGLLARIVRGGVTDGFSPEAGYLYWMISAAYGKPADIRNFDEKATSEFDDNALSARIHEFFEYMRVSGVLQSLHDMAAAVQFMQIDPGDMNSFTVLVRAEQAFERILEANEDRPGFAGSLRERNLKLMRRNVLLAHSALVKMSSAARVTYAKNVIETAADTEDGSEVNQDIIEMARLKDEELSNLMFDVTTDLTGGSHAVLINGGSRELVDSMNHAAFIPAAALVLGRIGVETGCKFITSYTDLYRVSECIARGAMVNSVKTTLSETPETAEDLSGIADSVSAICPDILHFRRGIEALFSVMFVLTSTSDEGLGSGFSYLMQREESKDKYGYDPARYARLRHTGVSPRLCRRTRASAGMRAGNWLRQILQIFSVSTNQSFGDMQKAFGEFAEGKFDKLLRTSRFKGSDKKGQRKNFAKAKSFVISIKNLNDLKNELLPKDKDGNPRKLSTPDQRALRSDIACGIRILESITRYVKSKDHSSGDVEIKPSELVNILLPWYTTVLSKFDGAPGFDSFSQTIANCFPGFTQAMLRQQANNDAAFAAWASRSRTDGKRPVVPFTDLWAATTNAPVNYDSSRRRTLDAMKADGIDDADLERADAAVCAVLDGGETPDEKYVHIIRSNPNGRFLFDIFRGDLAERITRIYAGMQNVTAGGTQRDVLAERERLKRKYRETQSQKVQKDAARSELPSPVKHAKVIADRAEAVKSQWTDPVLAKYIADYPLDGTPEEQLARVKESLYPDLDTITATWRKCGVPEAIVNDPVVILYRLAQEINLAEGRAEPDRDRSLEAGDRDIEWDMENPELMVVEPGYVCSAEDQIPGDENLTCLFQDSKGNRTHDTVVVLDTETTGLSPSRDRVVQISARKYVRNSDGTLSRINDFNVFIRPDNVRSDEDIKNIYSIKEKRAFTVDDVKNGVTISEALAKFRDYVADGGCSKPLFVAHNAGFDASMLFAESIRTDAEFLRFMHSADWLDTATVARDRTPWTKKECFSLEPLAVRMYGLKTEENGVLHNALADVDLLDKLLVKLNTTRGDLAKYINRVGFNAKYGFMQETDTKTGTEVDGYGAHPSTLTPGVQRYISGGKFAENTMLRPSRIFPLEQDPMLDVNIDAIDNHAEEPVDDRPTSTKTLRFKNTLEATLSLYSSPESELKVTTEGNTIIVERYVTGGEFLDKFGERVKTVVRIEMGHAGHALIRDGNMLTTDLNDDSTLLSLLGLIHGSKDPSLAAYQSLTLRKVKSLPIEARYELFRKIAPCARSLDEGMGGYTNGSPYWTVDGKMMRTLMTGIKLNEATANETTIFHEYFHAAMSMMVSIGAITTQDLQDLAKRYPPQKGAVGRLAMYDEERLAYAFGTYAYNRSRNIKTSSRNTGFFAKVWDILRRLLGGTRDLLRKFSYADEEVEFSDGARASTDEFLFDMVLSGGVVQSDTGAAMTAADVRKHIDMGRKVDNLEDLEKKVRTTLNRPRRPAVTKHRAAGFGKETVNFNAYEHVYWLESDPSMAIVSGTGFVELFSRFTGKAKGSETLRRWYEKGVASRETGTRVHGYLEDLVSGREIDPSKVPAKDWGLYQGALKFKKWMDDNGYQLCRGMTETIVYYSDLGIAGTIDLLLENKKTGELVLVDHKTNDKTEAEMRKTYGDMADIKTSFGKSIINEYSVQMELYRRMLQQEPRFSGKKISMKINHVRRDGSQQLYDVGSGSLTRAVDEMLEWFKDHRDEALDRLTPAKRTLQWPAYAVREASTPTEVMNAVDEIAATSNNDGDMSREFDHIHAIATQETISTDNGYLTTSQDQLHNLAASPTFEGLEPEDGPLDRLTAESMTSHYRQSLALSQIITKGVDGLPADMLDLLRNTSDDVIIGGIASRVVDHALKQLANVYGAELPEGGTEASKLMYRAAGLVYKAFNRYRFNQTGGFIRAGREHQIDWVHTRRFLTYAGLAAGTLIQSGVSYDDIVNNTLSDLMEKLASARAQNKMHLAAAINHMIVQVLHVARNDSEADKVWYRLTAGFKAPRRADKQLEFNDFLPISDNQLELRSESYRKQAAKLRKLYPWQEQDFKDAFRICLRGVALAVAARNYAALGNEPILDPDGKDIRESLEKIGYLRNSEYIPEVEGLFDADGLTYEQWRERQKIGEPMSHAGAAALVGITDEDLMYRARKSYMNSSFMLDVDPEHHLISSVRAKFHGKDFRGISQDERSECARLISSFRDKAAYRLRYLGLDIRPGQKLLELITDTADLDVENGKTVRRTFETEEDRKRHVRHRFNAYEGRFGYGQHGDVVFTQEDQEVSDWFLKTADSFYSGSRYVYTNIGDLMFTKSDVIDRETGEVKKYDPADYTVEAIRERVKKGGMMSAIDRALFRLVGATDASAQLPKFLVKSVAEGGMGFYDDLVTKLIAALNVTGENFKKFTDTRDAYRSSMLEGKDTGLTVEQANAVNSGEVNINAEFDINREILELLDRAEVTVSQRQQKWTRSTYSEWGRGGRMTAVPVRGAIVMKIDDFLDYWHGDTCDARKKLVLAGRSEDELTIERIGGEAIREYRKARKFVQDHEWLGIGDGKLMHRFNSHLAFHAGQGAFKWMCERVTKDPAVDKLDKDTQNFLDEMMKGKGSASINQFRYLYDAFAIRDRDISTFKKRVLAGDYSPGRPASVDTGLSITPEDCADSRKVGVILYQRLHQLAMERSSGSATIVKKLGGYGAIATFISRFDQEMAESSVATGEGITPDQAFRSYGQLPANMQIFHHVGTELKSLADSIQFRDTFLGFLTSEDENGRPLVYARPVTANKLMTTDLIPEEIWEELSRWWIESNPELNLAYNESMSGRANAAALYDAITKSTGMKIGGRSFGALEETYMRGVNTVAQVIAVNDEDQHSDHSSIRNRLSGGEALGYLRQLFSIPRVIGREYRAGILERLNSWSKSMAVQCSKFFPIATKWESTTGAVGFLTALTSNSALGDRIVSTFTRLFGSEEAQKYRRDMVTMRDIIEMFNSDDPYLEYCRDVCAALGIQLSDINANSIEGDKTFVMQDVKRFFRQRWVVNTLGSKGAREAENLVRGFTMRGSERAFSYVLNAVKIATAMQMAQKLQRAAERQNKSFDIIHDLSPYADYLNEEIGGINPLKYAWASPHFLHLMSGSMFSWQWTKGAWMAGGGGVIEDAVFGGHMTNPEVRAHLRGRWLRMYGEIMIGVPAMMQALCKALGMMMGYESDDDKWFTWQNEESIGMSAFDITPLLKGLGRLEIVQKAKDIPVIGNLIPGYTGIIEGSRENVTSKDAYNTTGKRHYYMHFGKQGWEFFRWFNHPFEQAMSKLSLPLQKLLEGVIGYNIAAKDFDLPFTNMSFAERWLNFTTNGAVWNFVKAFFPFSFNTMSQYGDAGALSVLGPIKMGASRRKTINLLKSELGKWADNDRAGYADTRLNAGWYAVSNRVSSILHAAEVNGINPALAIREAIGQLQVKYYRILYDQLPKAIDASFDESKLRKAARALARLGAKLKNAEKAMRSQAEHHGIQWKKSPLELRMSMKTALNSAMTNPYQQVESLKARLAVDY